MTDFRARRMLGRTGREVGRIGLGSSFGLSASDVELAYHEYGVNYLYWGSAPRPGFGRGIRNLAKSHRDDLVVVVQTYIRSATLMKASFKLALKRLKLDYADVLLLGLFNKPPAQRIMDMAQGLVEAGLVKHVAISCHDRPTFQTYISDGFFDILHVRYNAAHRGAEEEVFPYLPEAEAPGAVAFTATRWGHLLEKKAAIAGRAAPTAADCYRFCLAHPAVDLVLSGPSNREQLVSNLSAIDRGPMDEDEQAWMRDVGDVVYGRKSRYEKAL